MNAGRKRKAPHLHFRERPDASPVWEIRDGTKRVSTRTADRATAERAMTAYMRNPERNLEADLMSNPKALRRAVHKSLRGAKWRSSNKGWRCDLTVDDILSIINEQGGVCALSGLGFFDTCSNEGRRKPFAPSIDRIDNLKGYEPSNIRVVLAIVNNAKADFSDAEFLVMCDSVARFGILSGPSQNMGAI